MRKFFVVAAVIFSSPLFAQDSTDTQPLDRVVVTTNKYPRKQSQTGKVITVIDRKMLDEMSGRTVGEIINTVAGTTINGANNVLGTNQRVSIRGSSDGNVLLLVDGIPVNDPSLISNYFDLNFFNPSQIERIEILKGGQSTLYGSDAVAGVINIITRKGGSKRFAPYASLNFGSYATVNAAAGLRGNTERINYHVSTNLTSSKGISSAFDSTAGKTFDKDGYKQSTFRADLGFKLSSRLQWNVFGNYSSYKTDIDAAAFRDDRDFIAKNKNLQAGTGFQWKHGGGQLRANYHYNFIDRFYLDDSADRGSFAYFSESVYTGRTHFVELYENYQWEKFSLLAGADYRYFNTDQVYESVSAFGPYETRLGDTARMWQISPYASLIFQHRGFNVELGGRWNHHSEYGNNMTCTFNPSYLFSKKLKVFANVSSAFKTPSLYQLYDPYSGNRDLGPEKTTNIEGGAVVYGEAVMLRANYFFRKTKNAIQYILTDPVFFTGQYRNINNQHNEGIETEFSLSKGGWMVNANYTYTNGKIRSAYTETGFELPKDTLYNNLYRVPDHAFNLFVNRSITSKFSVGTVLKYSGIRWEPVYAAPPVKLDGYFTIDISARYRFSEKFRVFADAKNITNTRYFDILGYNSRRFNFNVGLDMQF